MLTTSDFFQPVPESLRELLKKVASIQWMDNPSIRNASTLADAYSAANRAALECSNNDYALHMYRACARAADLLIQGHHQAADDLIREAMRWQPAPNGYMTTT